MHTLSLFTLLAATLAATPETAAPAEAPQFARDRQAILAMAGTYDVKFAFDETVTLDTASTPSESHRSHGHELVLIVEDRGDFISLQHLLVVVAAGEQQIVKHWRQDWQYEATDMLVFKGKDVWAREPIPAAQVKGSWTQTVFQVDDSPRYAGYAPWIHIGEQSYWESNETWRPLPRREKEHRSDYDVVVGRNRHSITPEGWLHEQDNYKLALSPQKRMLAREHGQNTYRRETDFDYSAAQKYWEDTSAFWKLVRAWWGSQIASRDTLHLATQTPDVQPHMRVLNLAEQVASGELKSQKKIQLAVEKELNTHIVEDAKQALAR